jgi:CheY-like chemotaxis protein
MSRILLIEPDKILADIYRQALTEAGYGVTYSADVQSAIDAVDNHVPDVVILELQLAGHNGVEFLYEFRSYPEWASIPVVVLSRVPDPALSPKLQAQLGIVAYLYKPETSLKNLLQTLERITMSSDLQSGAGA